MDGTAPLLDDRDVGSGSERDQLLVLLPGSVDAVGMTVTFKNRGTLATGSTSVAPSPNATPPVDGERSILAVGTKPSTATIEVPADWWHIFSVTGGTGVDGADTGPTRLAMFYRDGAFSGAQTVTITGGNTSYGAIYTYQQSAGEWLELAFTTGDNTTTGTAVYTQLCAANPGWAAGDAVHCAIVMPTDAHAGAFASINVTATGISGGTIDSALGVTSGTGNDLGGIVLNRSGVTGTASTAPTITTTFTGAANTYGPCGFVRLRDGAAGPGPAGRRLTRRAAAPWAPIHRNTM